MHDDFYQMYLEELDMIAPCGETETRELAAELAKQNHQAAERLIEGKLKFVLALAKEYAEQGVLMSDLVQEANMILTIFTREFAGAADTYDTELERAVREQLEAAVTVQHQEKDIEETVTARVNVLQDISQMMAEELGREASVEELAERMKMTVEEIRDIMKLSLDALSVSVTK